MIAPAALRLSSASTAQTHDLGAHLGRLLELGDLVLLHGDLGAGKTTLTQGIAQGLGVTDYVQSPTFTLVSEHDGRTAAGTPIRLYHLDLYRLTGDDLGGIGLDDYLAPTDGITVVEWPERAAAWLPPAYLLVRLEALGMDARRLTFDAVPTVGPYAAHVAALRSRWVV